MTKATCSSTRNSDDDEYDEIVEPVLGKAEPGEDHAPHAAYIYIPDLSDATGWAAHKVPAATDERPRRVGFREP